MSLWDRRPADGDEKRMLLQTAMADEGQGDDAESELVDKLDEAWKRQGLHSRMDLFRKALQAFLENAGETDVAAILASANA